MLFDIHALDARRSYKLVTATIVPRPIAWVVTLDDDGRCNAAPFSFFNCFGGHPPVVCVGIGQRSRSDKDSLAHIRARGEWVINLVPEALAAAMNDTATDFPRGDDELLRAGLATLPSSQVAVPRIAGSPVALECKLRQVLEVDRSGHIAIGEVVAVHVADEAVLDAERCHIDTAKLQLIGRMQSPGGYVRTRDTFTMQQLEFAQWLAAKGQAGPAAE